MSTSDSSFNANGPTVTAFETTDNGPRAYGVKVYFTEKCGVYAESTSHPPAMREVPFNDPNDPFPPRYGVYGTGDTVGVYGRSMADNTKSQTVPDPSTGVFGIGDVVGVRGRGNGVGVIGENIDFAEEGTGVSGTGNAVGVQGSCIKSTGGNGVKGIANGDLHGPPPDPVSTTTSGVFGQSQFAVGVIGDSLNGPGGVFRSEFQAGIVGHSTHGHGGIFESFPTDPQEGTSSAQMRIVPAKIPPGQRIAPFPPNPQIGDFFVRTVHTLLELPPRIQGQLWFFADVPSTFPKSENGWVQIV